MRRRLTQCPSSVIDRLSRCGGRRLNLGQLLQTANDFGVIHRTSPFAPCRRVSPAATQLLSRTTPGLGAESYQDAWQFPEAPDVPGVGGSAPGAECRAAGQSRPAVAAF